MGENELLTKLRSLRELPTLPAVLVPLLRHFEKPQDLQDMHEIVRLIAQDKSLAARCLQIANSPLYGASHEIESIQAAVIALGLTKVQEIAVSCSFLKLLPTLWFEVSPSTFWAHSLGCALVAREVAVRIAFPDPSKAYAAGLLHDVGIVGDIVGRTGGVPPCGTPGAEFTYSTQRGRVADTWDNPRGCRERSGAELASSCRTG